MAIEIATTPAPIEVVTPIKPSEAIRLGCLTTAQAFGFFADGPGTACAEGTIGVAFGCDPEDTYTSPKAERLINRMDRVIMGIPCPALDCDRDSTNLPHLNDEHRWSRERIADWLESRGL